MRESDRITRLALALLEDVAAEAECGSVDHTRGVRVALEWLVHIGAAQRWQVRQFLEYLAEPIHDPVFPEGEWYMRETIINGALHNWYQALGLERPDMVQRAPMTRRFAYDLLDSPDGVPLNPAMCNRYQPGERQNILNVFRAREARPMNDGPAIVHPRDPGWVVRREGDELVLDQMTWGFPVVLTGKRGQQLKPKPVNNARFDKLGGFWKRWADDPARRCLIPAIRYAEAVGKPGHMTTTWLRLKSAPVFAWAGLWRPSDEWGDVYTGVMTDNAPELAEIHDRSPVILAPEDWEAWLTAPLEELARFDRPWPADDVKVEATNVLWKSGGERRPFGGASG